MTITTPNNKKENLTEWKEMEIKGIKRKIESIGQDKWQEGINGKSTFLMFQGEAKTRGNDMACRRLREQASV